MPRGSDARRVDSGDASARKPKPFLKWAGGKGQLIEQFRPLLPVADRYSRYFEPFIGSAALFFDLRPPSAVLSDANRELVDCYRAIRTRVDEVVRELGKHEHDEAHYYRVRADHGRGSLPARAARTIYLNKTGYNGLYRVNRAGRFNVPMGRYTNPGYRSATLFANLRACSQALAPAKLREGDFEEILADAGEGDFVYLDPPYVPVSDTADFTSYVPGGFGWIDQERLARVCRELWARGALVMLSNSDAKSVRDLYAGFRIDTVLASRSINSRAAKRGKVREIVVRNYDATGLTSIPSSFRS